MLFSAINQLSLERTYRSNVVRQEDEPLVCRHLEFSGRQVLQKQETHHEMLLFSPPQRTWVNLCDLYSISFKVSTNMTSTTSTKDYQMTANCFQFEVVLYGDWPIPVAAITDPLGGAVSFMELAAN